MVNVEPFTRETASTVMASRIVICADADGRIIHIEIN